MEDNRGHQRPLLPSIGHLGEKRAERRAKRRAGGGKTHLDGGISIFGHPSST